MEFELFKIMTLYFDNKYVPEIHWLLISYTCDCYAIPNHAMPNHAMPNHAMDIIDYLHSL